MSDLRILSLIASSTEIICALGFEKNLVGVSHECDYPESICHLPRCTETKIFTEESSYRIDERVKAILQESLSVYRVHGERIRELKPDVIVTQTQCEVCAVSLSDVKRAACEWTDLSPIIVSLSAESLEGFWRDIRDVAHALGDSAAGENLVAKLKARMNAVALRANRAFIRPTVACIEWMEPLMAAGNWMPELVEMAGGTNLFGIAGKHSPWMTWDELVERDPDIIIVTPCGFDIRRTLSEISVLTSHPEWNKLRAVRERSVFVADGNQFFNRPGPRLIESLEILAEIFHPDLFPPKHRETGWVPIQLRADHVSSS